MTDWMEEMGLHHFGFSDEEIAQIDAAIPKFKYVWDLVNHNKTVAAELFTVIGMILDRFAAFQKGQEQ